MTNEEINSRIATEIMGWEELRIGYYGTEDETPRQKELEDWLDKLGVESVGEYYIEVNKNYIFPKELWEPCKLIEQAWEVLEKFPPKDYKIIICPSYNGWICQINKWTEWSLPTETETAPMAICLAALKAIRK